MNLEMCQYAGGIIMLLTYLACMLVEILYKNWRKKKDERIGE